MAVSTTLVQIACLAVLVCAFFSGALASCRVSLYSYNNGSCNIQEFAFGLLTVQDDACTSLNFGEVTISTFANCTAQSLVLYAADGCTGENVELANGVCTATNFGGDEGGALVVFGGASSRLTSWISLLASLF